MEAVVNTQLNPAQNCQQIRTGNDILHNLATVDWHLCKPTSADDSLQTAGVQMADSHCRAGEK